MYTESCTAYAMVRPSGAHTAEMIGPWDTACISGRAAPPEEGALKTSPLERKRIREPSADHDGLVCISSESSVTRAGRPPVTCRTYIRMLTVVPAA
jgi:hypothetical protein